jgi:Sigma-70 region 2
MALNRTDEITAASAWRGRDSFDGSSLFRAWLYRTATNVCIDMRRRNSRRPATMHSFAEVPWLQPYPDRLLDEVAPSDEQPDAVAVERETIELAFLAAMQEHLPARRADWSAGEPSAQERALGEDRDGDWRLVPTQANRMPTAASYLRRPGDSEFRAFKFDVLRIEGNVIGEITTFGAGMFPAFGLPPML